MILESNNLQNISLISPLRTSNNVRLQLLLLPTNSEITSLSHLVSENFMLKWTSFWYLQIARLEWTSSHFLTHVKPLERQAQRQRRPEDTLKLPISVSKTLAILLQQHLPYHNHTRVSITLCMIPAESFLWRRSQLAELIIAGATIALARNNNINPICFASSAAEIPHAW